MIKLTFIVLYTPLVDTVQEQRKHDSKSRLKRKTTLKKIPYNVTNMTNESIELLLCTIIKYTRRNTDQMNSAFRNNHRLHFVQFAIYFANWFEATFFCVGELGFDLFLGLFFVTNNTVILC